VFAGLEITGVVTEWDEPRGIGVITGDDGTPYPFHCTQLADGTRSTKVDTKVRFQARPWHQGRIEAIAIWPR
jgi:hypothetical protein